MALHVVHIQISAKIQYPVFVDLEKLVWPMLLYVHRHCNVTLEGHET